MEGALIDPLAGSLSTLVGWTCCQTSSNEIKCSRSYMPRQSWSISYPEYINKTHKDRHNTGPCGCSTTSMVSSCKTSQTSILCLLLWGGGGGKSSTFTHGMLKLRTFYGRWIGAKPYDPTPPMQSSI